MVIKPCHNLGFRANYHQWAPVGTSGAPVGTGVGSRWARIFRLGVYDRRSERWNIVKRRRRRRKRNRQETGTWGWGGAIVIRRCIYFGFRKSERRRKWTGDGPRLRVGSRVGHMLDAWGVVKSYSNDLTDDLPFWLLALVCVGVDGSSQDMAGIVRDVAEKLGNLQESSEIVRHVEESSGIVKESSGIVKDGFCRWLIRQKLTWNLQESSRIPKNLKESRGIIKIRQRYQRILEIWDSVDDWIVRNWLGIFRNPQESSKMSKNHQESSKMASVVDWSVRNWLGIFKNPNKSPRIFQDIGGKSAKRGPRTEESGDGGAAVGNRST